MALSRNPLMSFIIDGSTLKAHQRKHSPQEQIHFMVILKCTQSPGGDQTVVGMVVDNFRPHLVHHFVKAFRRHPFEPGIGISAGADAVDDLAAVKILPDHLVHGIDVILPVTIDGDRNIAVLLGLHETGQNGVLVSAVSALCNPDIPGVFFGQ